MHRDVKPANVLLAAGDHAYLSDFGLTRHVRSTSGATHKGQWVGTLDFVAPEQIRGGKVDARADVYALGCVLFFLLTGGVPFPRDGDEAKLWAHLTEPPPDVSAAAPEAAAFDPVIRRALAKSPDDRHPSAGDLGRAAEAAAAGVPVAERERTVARGGSGHHRENRRSRAAHLPVRHARRGTARALAGAATVAAAVGRRRATDHPVPARDAKRAASRPRPRRPPAPAGRPKPLTSSRQCAGDSRPNSLAPAGDHIWVGAWRTGRLAAIDTDATGCCAACARAPMAARRTSSAPTTYCGSRRGTARSCASTPCAVGRSGPRALARTPRRSPFAGTTSGSAEELDGEPAEIVRIDAASGNVKPPVPAPARIPGWYTWTAVCGRCTARRTTSRGRDPVTRRRIENVPLPGSTVGALASGAGALWATLPDEDQLVRYQPRTGNRATVSVGGRPIGVTVHGKHVWVAALRGRARSSASRRAACAPSADSIRVPLNPLAIAVTADAIWVTCVGENVVARVAAPS